MWFVFKVVIELKLVFLFIVICLFLCWLVMECLVGVGFDMVFMFFVRIDVRFVEELCFW